MPPSTASGYTEWLIRRAPWLALLSSARYIAVLYDKTGSPHDVVNRTIHRLDYVLNNYLKHNLTELFQLPPFDTLDDFFRTPELAWVRQGLCIVPPDDLRLDQLRIRLFPTFQSFNKREGLAFYEQIYTLYPFSLITIFKLDEDHYLGIVSFKEFFLSDYFKGISVLTDTTLRLTMFGRGFKKLLGSEQPEQAINQPLTDFLSLSGPLMGLPESIPKPHLRKIFSWENGEPYEPFLPATHNQMPVRENNDLILENRSVQNHTYYRADTKANFHESNFEFILEFQTETNTLPNILFGGRPFSGAEMIEDLDALRFYSDDAGHGVIKTVIDKLFMFRHPFMKPGSWHTLEISRCYHMLRIRLDNSVIGECRYEWSAEMSRESELSLYIRSGEKVRIRSTSLNLAPMQLDRNTSRSLEIMASPRHTQQRQYYKVHVMPLFLDIDKANTLLLRFEDVTPLQSDIDFLQKDKEALTRVIQGHKHFIGVSTQMIEIRQLMGRVADTDMTILIEGETGTGKEVLAKALHTESKRRDKSFVKIDCAAIPENLMESELFGHEKGAFTGASEAHAGRFEQAQGGTVFLDEISNLSRGVQAKLLSVLQDLKIQRLGGSRTVQLNVRIISASNIPLLTLVRQGLFREDLYYRLNQFRFALPPLRERPEDIALMAAQFAEEARLINGRGAGRLSPDALKTLIDAEWPGNVRELKSTVYRAVLLSDGETLEPGDFANLTKVAKFSSGRRSILTRKKRIKLNAEEISELIKRNHGNVTLTAEDLGISRLTLYQWIKKHQLNLDNLR